MMEKEIKKCGRVLPVVLAGALVFTSSASAWPGAFVQAQPKASSKEEVVYINLDTSGEVKEVYVVNIFGKGDVTDYGDYSSVKMLNTTDAIGQEGDRITFTASGDRVYYEGTLENAVIPWKISLRYFLDGKEYSADEIAGKSGALEIRMKISENGDCEGSFFEDYALQATFVLDTQRAFNIEAQDATVANVGAKKQLTYTILPGSEKEIFITADVVDFEMDAASINGVRLNLDVEVDEEELLDQVRRLQDAIASLDDGSLEMKDGVAQLKESVESDLAAGSGDLDEGAQELRDGAATLKEGTSALQSGAWELQSGTEALYDGAVSLDSGISSIDSGLQTLVEKAGSLTEGSAQIKAALLQLQEKLPVGAVSEEDLTALVNASAQMKSGIEAAKSGVSAIRQSASVDAYEAAMTAQLTAAGALAEGQTFSLSGMKAQNEAAIAGLQSLIGALAGETETVTETTTTTTTAAEETAEDEQGGDADDGAAQEDGADADGSQDDGASTSSAGDTSTSTTVTSYTRSVDNSQTIAQLGNVVGLLQMNNANIDGTITYLSGVSSALAVLELGENQDGTGGLTALAAGYAQFDGQIQSLAVSLGDLSEGLSELKSGVDALVKAYEALDSGITEYTGGVAAAREGSSRLKSGSSALVDGAGSLKNGSSSLYGGTQELLDGIVEFYEGAGTLKDGTGKLDEGVQELLTAVIALYDGTAEMKDGTGELREETDGLDQEIQEQIDELLETISGGDGECVSFVSEKNTDVSSVQFVIQTEAVKAEEIEEAAAEPEVKLTLWQKLQKLFGIE